MKINNYKYLLYVLSITCLAKPVFAVNYDKEISKLQNQLDELKVKQEKNENSSFNGFQFNGRLAILSNFYSANSNFDEQLNGLNNKTSIKTARLGVSKSINDFLFYSEINYNGDKATLGQNFISYSFNDKNEIKVGQLALPSFMENEKSTNILAVSTYSPWLYYLPVYLIGVGYVYTGDKVGLAVGAYGNGTDQEGKLENDTSFSTALRSFYTPIRNDTAVLHFGIDLMYRDLKTDRFINSEEINSSYYYGFEFAAQYKNITFENEFINLFNKYDKNTGLKNKYYSSFGFTSQLIVGFTGEKRIYDKYGAFNFVEVKNPLNKGGFGGFEGVLKFVIYDGKDSIEETTVNTGSGWEFTVGLNWFPIDNVMFLANYSRNKNSEIVADKKEYDAYRLEARMFF